MWTIIALVVSVSLLYGLLAIQLYCFWKIRKYGHHLAAEIHSLDRTVNSGVGHIEDSLRLYTELSPTCSLLPMRDWAAGPDFLLELALHVKTEKPRVIVECGSGVSTIVLARCAEMNGRGHVYSIEHLPDFADKTRQELARHGLAAYATVLTAPLVRHDIKNEVWLWYTVPTLLPDEIELLVIAGPPATTGHLVRYPAGPLLFKHLSPYATVFLDDAFRSDEQEIVDRWVLEFPEYHRQVKETQRGCAILRKETQEEVLRRCNSLSIADVA